MGVDAVDLGFLDLGFVDLDFVDLDSLDAEQIGRAFAARPSFFAFHNRPDNLLIFLLRNSLGI